jgi:hypothetical protein
MSATLASVAILGALGGSVTGCWEVGAIVRGVEGRGEEQQQGWFAPWVVSRPCARGPRLGRPRRPDGQQGHDLLDAVRASQGFGPSLEGAPRGAEKAAGGGGEVQTGRFPSVLSTLFCSSSVSCPRVGAPARGTRAAAAQGALSPGRPIGSARGQGGEESAAGGARARARVEQGGGSRQKHPHLFFCCCFCGSAERSRVRGERASWDEEAGLGRKGACAVEERTRLFLVLGKRERPGGCSGWRAFRARRRSKAGGAAAAPAGRPAPLLSICSWPPRERGVSRLLPGRSAQTDPSAGVQASGGRAGVRV